MESYEKKCEMLHELMDEYAKEDVAVAFSGGADSSLLLKLAALHAKDHGTKVHAITAHTTLHPAGDMRVAKSVAKELGVNHVVVEIEELEKAGILDNPYDRCYRCKKYLFTDMKEKAEQLGAAVIIEGTNADDLLVYRPGIRAVDELGIKSPLKEAGFTKAEVRKLAGEYGISVSERPAAPCLATRFPYGDKLSEAKLKKVEQGENYLKTMGLYNVRLRVHGEIARIEVDGTYMEKILDNREDIVKYLKDLGYRYVTLDLEGFRSGSMDKN